MVAHMQKKIDSTGIKSSGIRPPVSGPILFLFSLILLVGCAPMHMAVPKDLVGKAQAMPITVKKTWYIFDINKISFGPFAANKFKLGWDHSSTLSVSMYSASGFSKNYSFALKQDKGSEWKCDCAVKAVEKDVKGKLFGGDLSIPIKNKINLNCTFKGSPTDSTWTLDLAKNANKTDVFTGELSGGGEKIQVESLDEYEGRQINLMNDPLGYVYRIRESAIGAVETLDKGRVWIVKDSTVGLRPQLALASTALIVFQDVLKSLEEKKVK